MSARTYVSPYWAKKLGIEEQQTSDNKSFESAHPILSSLGMQNELLNTNDINKAAPFIVGSLCVALSLLILI